MWNARGDNTIKQTENINEHQSPDNGNENGAQADETQTNEDDNLDDPQSVPPNDGQSPQTVQEEYKQQDEEQQQNQQIDEEEEPTDPNQADEYNDEENSADPQQMQDDAEQNQKIIKDYNEPYFMTSNFFTINRPDYVEQALKQIIKDEYGVQV